MTPPQTKEDLNKLIADKVEENLHLDYKDGRSFLPDGKKNPKTEIAKDVSAMANSAGGIIIYGIKEFEEPEKQHLPEKITPIDRMRFSREWLEQVINGNIGPKVEGVQIHPVPLDQTNEVVYVVETPKSTTAHQNTADGRYYRRDNFVSVPMLDHEIRDIMNRTKHPVIELGFEIEMETYEVKDDMLGGMSDSFSRLHKKKEYQTEVSLRVFPANNGNVFAQYINYFVYLPDDIVDSTVGRDPNLQASGMFEFYGENTFRDVIGIQSFGTFSRPQYGPSRFDPVLPGLRGRSEKIKLVDNPTLDAREITWTVHADNAAPRKGSMKLNQIPIVRRSDG